MNVDLRVSQMRDERKVERLQEIVQLRRSARARIDAHRHETQRKLALLHRFVFRKSREKALGRRHVECRGRQRDQHDIGAAHRIAQALAIRARRGVDDEPLRIEILQILFPGVAVLAHDGRKERRATHEPLRSRTLRIGVR